MRLKALISPTGYHLSRTALAEAQSAFIVLSERSAGEDFQALFKVTVRFQKTVNNFYDTLGVYFVISEPVTFII